MPAADDATAALPGRTPARRWRRAIVPTSAVLLALFVAFLASLVIDARWLRPLIRHHVAERSQRQIDFEGLRFGLTPTFEPRVIFRGLYIQNAPWADPRPFVKAGVTEFDLTWASLWRTPIIIKRLTLIDAEVDMERTANGRRNWRLTRPLDTGPGQVRVQSLVAQRSSVRYIDQDLKLSLETRSTDLAAPETLAEMPGQPLTRRIAFSGQRDGLAFTGEVDTSDALTFIDSGEDFALRGHAQIDRGLMQLHGSAGDVLRLDRVDVALHLACNTLADLAHIFPTLKLPASRPATADMQLTKRLRDWKFDGLTAKIGGTSVEGSASLQTAAREGEPRRFSLDLHSALVDADDVAGFMHPSSSAKAASAAASSPTSLFDRAVLQASEGRFDLRAAKTVHFKGGNLADARMAGTLQESVLTVDPIGFSVYGGKVAASMRVDASRTPAQVSLDVQAHDLQLDAMLRSIPSVQALRGALQSRFSLRSQGESLDALARGTGGSVRFAVADASMPARLEAKLALDGGRWLAALVKGDPRVAVRCAQLAIDFRDGRGTARRAVVETEHAKVRGSGSVDLAETRYELLLTPRARDRTWLALDRSIEVKGSGLQATTRLVETPAGRPDPESCADDAADAPLR